MHISMQTPTFVTYTREKTHGNTVVLSRIERGHTVDTITCLGRLV